MNKNILLLFVELVLGVIWIIFCLLPFNLSFLSLNYMIGAIMVIGELFLVMLLTYIKSHNESDSTIDLSYVPVYFSFIFIILSFNINYKLMLIKNWNVLGISLISNLILTVAYIALVALFLSYKDRVNRQVETMKGKMENIENIKLQLSSLLGIVEDEEVKEAVYKLKETVDFSNNISQSYTQQLEQNVILNLDLIREEVLKNENKEDILKLINQTKILWNDRNTRISSIR